MHKENRGKIKNNGVRDYARSGNRYKNWHKFVTVFRRTNRYKQSLKRDKRLK
jgi:hypothetical protein